ncbi:hypothetical protein LOTGIDRAFT_156038 [Lottia gigantea]|uniref:Uncharacterized protein n=1 Tax=Lottia gigantea TaxID=225164 RepID=V4CQS0_LOTGI|nr:hypothetical protein LOTGIDRAFT_156038 [Lottia gigantea]ESP04815.1 hypothetical protein LOTGIDRAFT_156038 [Lottia gigantea]
MAERLKDGHAYIIPNNTENSSVVEAEAKRLRVVRGFRTVSCLHIPFSVLTILVSLLSIVLVRTPPRFNFATVTPILIGAMGVVNGFIGFAIGNAAFRVERIDKTVHVQVVTYVIVGTCVLLLVPMYTGFSLGICDAFSSIICMSDDKRDITLGALNIAIDILLFITVLVNFCLLIFCQKNLGVGFLIRRDNLYERISMSDRKEPSFQLALRDDCYSRLQNGGEDYPDVLEDVDKNVQSVENGYYTWDSPPTIET